MKHKFKVLFIHICLSIQTKTIEKHIGKCFFLFLEPRSFQLILFEEKEKYI